MIKRPIKKDSFLENLANMNDCFLSIFYCYRFEDDLKPLSLRLFYQSSTKKASYFDILIYQMKKTNQ